MKYWKLGVETGSLSKINAFLKAHPSAEPLNAELVSRWQLSLAEFQYVLFYKIQHSYNDDDIANGPSGGGGT